MRNCSTAMMFTVLTVIIMTMFEPAKAEETLESIKQRVSASLGETKKLSPAQWKQIEQLILKNYKEQKFRAVLRVFFDNVALAPVAPEPEETEKVQNILSLFHGKAPGEPEHPMRETNEFTFAISDCLLKLAHFHEAETFYESIVDREDEKTIDAPQNKVRAFNKLAEIALLKGKLNDAHTFLDEAASLAAKKKLDDLNTAESQLLLAKLQWQRRDIKQSQNKFSEVLALARKLGVNGTGLEAGALDGLANLNYYMGNTKLAFEQAEKSRTLRTQLFGAESLEAAESMLTLATIYSRTNPTECSDLRLKAFANQIKILGTTANPVVAATILMGSSSIDESVSNRELVCEIAKQSAGGIVSEESPFIAECLYRKAAALNAQERLRPAMELCNHLLKLEAKLYGDDSLHSADTLDLVSSIALSDAVQRKIALKESFEKIECPEGLKAIERALAIANSKLGPDSLKVALLSISLATLKNYAGEYSEAESVAKKSLHVLEELLPENDSRLIHSRKVLLQSCLKQEKTDEAKAVLSKLLNYQLTKTGVMSIEFYSQFRDLAKIEEGKTESMALTLLQVMPDYESGDRLLGTMAMLKRHYAGPGSDDAREYVDELNKRILKKERKFGKQSPNLVRDLLLLAEALAKAGENSKAIEEYENILSIQEDGLGKDHPALIETLTDYAKFLDSQGKEKEFLPKVVF